MHDFNLGKKYKVRPTDDRRLFRRKRAGWGNQESAMCVKFWDNLSIFLLAWYCFEW